MTVSAETRKAGPYAGNGSATAFSFNFKVLETSDVLVIHVDDDDVPAVLTLDSDYTVTLNADQDLNPGGTVNYPLSGSALASDESLTIRSNVTLKQLVDLVTGGPWLPQVVENALDRALIHAQQLRDRSILQPLSDIAPIGELPSKLSRLGKFLAFDAGSGDPVASAGSGSVSDAALIAYIRDAAEGVASSIKTKLDDYVSVVEFKNDDGTRVVGDSTEDRINGDTLGTDNCTGIQSAIDWCRDNGKALYVPPLTVDKFYRITKPLMNRSGVVIFGGGYRSFIKNTTDASNTGICMLMGNMSPVSTTKSSTSVGALGANPFTTVNGSKKVLIDFPAHGTYTGYNITIAGAAAVGGITPAGDYIVHRIDDDTLEITHSVAAGASATGGGAGVTYTDFETPDIARYRIASAPAGQDNVVLVTAAESANFEVGDFVWIASDEAHAAGNGSVRNDTSIVNKVKSIAGDTITLEKPLLLDVGGTLPYISVIGDGTVATVVTGSSEPCQMIERAALIGLRFGVTKVSESWKRLGGSWECLLKDLYTDSDEILEGNLMCYDYVENVRGTYYNQVSELALGSQGCLIVGVRGSFDPDVGTSTPSADIVIHEGSHHNVFVAPKANHGEGGAPQCVRFNHPSRDNLVIGGQFDGADVGNFVLWSTPDFEWNANVNNRVIDCDFNMDATGNGFAHQANNAVVGICYDNAALNCRHGAGGTTAGSLLRSGGNGFVFRGNRARRRAPHSARDPLTVTNGSAVVTVNWPQHRAKTGMFATLINTQAVGGITPAGSYAITVVDADNFTITHGSAAGSDAVGGGYVLMELSAVANFDVETGVTGTIIEHNDVGYEWAGTPSNRNNLLRHNTSRTHRQLVGVEDRQNNVAVNATAANNKVSNYTLPADSIVIGDRIRGRVRGTIAGTNGVKDLRVDLAGTSLFNKQFAAAAVGAFDLEFEIVFTAGNAQRAHAIIRDLTNALLTDSTGGSANDTLATLSTLTDSPATADALRDEVVTLWLPEIENNLADLAAKVNVLLAGVGTFSRSTGAVNTNTTDREFSVQAWVANAADTITIDSLVVEATRRYH